MPVRLSCPNPSCRKQSLAPEEFTGKTVRCKHCGQAFVATPTLDAPSPSSARLTTNDVGLAERHHVAVASRLNASRSSTSCPTRSKPFA